MAKEWDETDRSTIADSETEPAETQNVSAVDGSGMRPNGSRRRWAVLGGSLGTLAIAAVVLVVVIALRSSEGGSVERRDERLAEVPQRSGVGATDDGAPLSAPARSVTTAGTAAPVTLVTSTTSPVPAKLFVESAVLPVAVTASSYLPSSTLRCNGEVVDYAPGNLFDNDPNSGWGTSGDGAGSWVDVEFGEQRQISRVGLTAGYTRVGPRSDAGCAHVSAFDQNRIVSAVRIEFDEGTTVTHRLVATEAVQWFDVEAIASGFRLVVESTELPAGADDDTVISTMEIVGLSTAGE